MVSKKGQVWIETVLYLLIGLAVIAAILAFVRPKVSEIQDKIVLDQSVGMLKQLDGKINEVWDNGEGNRQIAEITIKKGSLTIEPGKETIRFVMEDSNALYSQLDKNVPIGSVTALTKKVGSGKTVELWLNYSDVLNLTYANTKNDQTFNKAPSPYRISITNVKINNDHFIDIDLIS